MGQTTLNPVRCLQVGHEDFNDFRDGDGERLLGALLDYEDSTFKPLQLYRSPEPGCKDVRDSDSARFCMIACGCALWGYLNCGKQMPWATQEDRLKQYGLHVLPRSGVMCFNVCQLWCSLI